MSIGARGLYATAKVLQPGPGHEARLPQLKRAAWSLEAEDLGVSEDGNGLNQAAPRDNHSPEQAQQNAEGYVAPHLMASDSSRFGSASLPIFATVGTMIMIAGVAAITALYLKV